MKTFTFISPPFVLCELCYGIGNEPEKILLYHMTWKIIQKQSGKKTSLYCAPGVEQ